MDGRHTENEVQGNDQIQAEPAKEQKGLEQNNAEPNHAEKYPDIDPNQIGGPKQNAGTETENCFPLTGQEEGDGEQVREDKEWDIGFEILTIDRHDNQSLEKGKPEGSVQSPKEKKGDQTGTGRNDIKIGSHQGQMGSENPEKGADRIKPGHIVSERQVAKGPCAVHQRLADQGDASFVGKIQAISVNQGIVEDRKQDESRGRDEAIPSSIQCIHLKIKNPSGGGPFDFWVK